MEWTYSKRSRFITEAWNISLNFLSYLDIDITQAVTNRCHGRQEPGQHHVFRWPEDMRGLGINCHDVDLLFPEYSAFSTTRITVPSSWYQDRSEGLVNNSWLEHRLSTAHRRNTIFGSYWIHDTHSWIFMTSINRPVRLFTPDANVPNWQKIIHDVDQLLPEYAAFSTTRITL